MTDFLEKAREIKRRADTDLLYFSKYVLGYAQVEEVPHRELCDRLVSDTKKKLILLPRGSFKSTIATISFPIWKLTQDPNLRILISSETYGQSKTFLTAIKQQIEANELFKTIYGELKKEDTVWRQEEITVAGRTKVAREPSIGVSGVGQTKVGLHYDIIILDDVVSDRNINTPDQIAKTINHYKLLLSILEPGGLLIIIGTRYSFADLYGHLLENEKDVFDILIRSAIDDKGKLYFPTRLTLEYLDNQKKAQGPQHYSNQYLNNPIDQGTAIFRKGWLRYFKDGPSNTNKYLLIDPASTNEVHSDFTGIIICGVDEQNNIFVYEAINNKSTIGEMIALVFEKVMLYKIHEAGCVALEINANQHTYQYIFSEEMSKRKYYFPITELKPSSTRSKMSRIKALQPWFENGRIYVRKEQTELIDQLLMYPRTRHDDLCLSGGTLVMTLSGLKPIADINVNDYVWTRMGPKRVSHKSCRLDICRDFVVNGMDIRCTPNHNVITASGKRPIENLTSKDIVFINKTWGLSKQLYLTEKRIEDILRARKGATEYISSVRRGSGRINRHISIETFGNLITEKYLRVVAYTIKTRILLTTTFPISNLKKLGSTCLNICKRGTWRSKGEGWITPEPLPQNGMGAKTEKSFTNCLENGRGKTRPPSRSNASFAEKKSMPTLKRESFATTKLVGINTEECRREKVYNLTVEDCHEYLAGGVLVSNCDSLSNILQVMVPTTASKPKDPLEGTNLTANERIVWANKQKLAKRFVHRTKISF